MTDLRPNTQLIRKRENCPEEFWNIEEVSEDLITLSCKVRYFARELETYGFFRNPYKQYGNPLRLPKEAMDVLTYSQKITRGKGKEETTEAILLILDVIQALENERKAHE